MLHKSYNTTLQNNYTIYTVHATLYYYYNMNTHTSKFFFQFLRIKLNCILCVNIKPSINNTYTVRAVGTCIYIIYIYKIQKSIVRTEGKLKTNYILQ